MAFSFPTSSPSFPEELWTTALDQLSQQIRTLFIECWLKETMTGTVKRVGIDKGAIRIPLNHPISEEMLKQIIHLRLKEITPS